jgi:hypothetical protein
MGKGKRWKCDENDTGGKTKEPRKKEQIVLKEAKQSSARKKQRMRRMGRNIFM